MEISRWCNHRNSSGNQSRPGGAQDFGLILRPSRARDVLAINPVVSPPANIFRPSGTLQNRQLGLLSDTA